MSPTREQLLKTAMAFLDAYNGWTVDSVMSMRAPSCVHYTFPKSMGSPPRNNEEFSTFLGEIIQTFRNFRLQLVSDEEVMIDEVQRKVSMHLKSNADTDVGEYVNEYIFTLRITEDGTMVDQIVEWLDSAYTAGIVAKLTAKAQEA